MFACSNCLLDIPYDSANELPDYEIPSKFYEYGLHSSFIRNYWSTITTFACLIAFSYLLTFIERTLKNPHHKLVAAKFKVTFKWNMFLLIFCSSYDEITLYTSFDLKTCQFDQWLTSISTIISVLFSSIAIFFLFFSVWLVKGYQRTKNQVVPLGYGKNYLLKKYCVKWEAYQVLFRGYKDHSFLQQAYCFFFMLRYVIYNLTFALLYQYPLVQAIMITSLSIFILIIILTKKPFLSWVSYWEQLTYESIGFLVNCCVLILAIADAANVEVKETRELLADVIIYSFLIFSAFAIFYLVLYLITGFKAAHETTKKVKGAGKISWLQALAAPLQVGGMNFENIEDEKPPSLPELEEAKQEAEKSNSENSARILQSCDSSSSFLNPIKRMKLKQNSLHFSMSSATTQDTPNPINFVDLHKVTQPDDIQKSFKRLSRLTKRRFKVVEISSKSIDQSPPDNEDITPINDGYGFSPKSQVSIDSSK